MLHVARSALSALLLALNTVAPGLDGRQARTRTSGSQTDGRVVIQRPVPARRQDRGAAIRPHRAVLRDGEAETALSREAEFLRFRRPSRDASVS